MRIMTGRPKKRQEERFVTTKLHNSPICNRLNELINENNQKEFCKALDITERTVYHWKKGQSRPDIDKLADIANFFKVTTDYLTGRIDIPAPTQDLVSICEYTGLSKNSILELSYMKNPRTHPNLQNLEERFSKIEVPGLNPKTRADDFYKRAQNTYGRYLRVINFLIENGVSLFDDLSKAWYETYKSANPTEYHIGDRIEIGIGEAKENGFQPLLFMHQEDFEEFFEYQATKELIKLSQQAREKNKQGEPNNENNGLYSVGEIVI